jgi:hypothetical protein
MQRKLTSLMAVGFCAALALAAVATQAQDKQDKKVDVTGTWKWTAPAGRNGNPGAEMTLKLKADGEKVTGALTYPPRGGQGDPTDVAISDGKLKGDALSFNVVRDFNGTSITNMFEGKVSGDTIKGTQPGGRGGRRNGGGGGDTSATPPPAPVRPEWTATRAK